MYDKQKQSEERIKNTDYEALSDVEKIIKYKLEHPEKKTDGVEYILSKKYPELFKEEECDYVKQGRLY